MALRSSIFKASVSLSNLNTNYYDDLSFTIALHPSETEERMMYRLLAFLYCAHERLEFTEGLNNPDLPDIWQKDLTGQIEHWIDLGLPEEKRIRKASGQSDRVSIFTYNAFKAKVWYGKIKSAIENNKKVNVFHFAEDEPEALQKLVERSMVLNCLIEDNQIFLSNNDTRIQIDIKQHPL
jgi:uncharacterized protein YaeQ